MIIFSAVLALVVAAFAVWLTLPAPQGPEFNGKKVRCIIHTLPKNESPHGLVTGYTYHLLKKYSEFIDADFDIRLCDPGESCLDSLKAGKVDLVAFPYSENLETDSLLVSIPVDSLSVWIVNPHRKKDLKQLNSWIEAYHASNEYVPTREMFLRRFKPESPHCKPTKYLSPYDDLIKKYAAQLKWDWRMLAAIIFQESKFRIDARSHKDAAGLMQIREATAKRFGSGELLDPEECISTGTRYLEFLYNRYYRFSANDDERMKFTLAAYNAGEGRIKQCIEHANEMGRDSSYWENVEFGFDEIDDFRGDETIFYIMRVLFLYDRFCSICPD